MLRFKNTQDYRDYFAVAPSSRLVQKGLRTPAPQRPRLQFKSEQDYRAYFARLVGRRLS